MAGYSYLLNIKDSYQPLNSTRPNEVKTYAIQGLIVSLGIDEAVSKVKSFIFEVMI